ncbi:BACON domain-containing protein [uncultured Draconibacterium sp.]|uniref:BACON domain-containing protein n=1 Tax=uncultured Draconibacterium sp. TaxID=1573823 RepID=UPI0032180CE7
MKKFYILLIALAHFGVLRAQTHFTPDFEGNGFDHMNIFVVESVIEGADMQAGDEIAVFDGAVCAGVFVLNEALTDGSIGLINASKADQDTSGAYLSNGYTPGNALSFKLWDASHGIEYEDVDITFVDNQSGEEVDPVPFTVGASVFVRVIVDYPCMFEVYPNTLSIDSLGEEVFAPIITYHAWEVTAAPDWILFDNPSGFGSDTLNINISVNHGVDRSGVIELEGCDGLTESISVEQEGPAPCTLSVSTPVLTRSSDAGIKGVNVLSNSSWEVASSPSWITVSPLSGFGDGRVTLDYEANTSAFRTGVVTLTSCDDAVATITVNQLGVLPCELSVQESILDVSEVIGSQDVGVLSNADWTVTDAPAWVTVTPLSGTGDGSVNVSWEENISSSRQGIITLMSCEGVTATITVNQAGAEPCVLSVENPVLTRSSDAGIKGVNVLSNSSWEVASSPSWITVSPLSGFGDGRVTLDYEANTSAFRTGVVTLTSCDDAVATITVNQLGVLPCELSVQESILDVSEVIGSQDVGVLSNADWTFTDAPAWVTVTPLSGTGDGSVNVSWEENISSSRQGIITLMSCEGVTATITVNQAGAEPCVLSVENPVLTRSSDAGIKGVNVLSNSSWEVASSPSWITVSPLSGFGDGRVTLDYEANTSAFRTGVVTLTSCDDAVATITVNQLGVLPCELSVQESILDVSEVIGSQDVGVLSNADWTFTDAPAWVTVTPLSGTGDGSWKRIFLSSGNNYLNEL